MKKIPRHAVDLELATEGIESKKSLVDSLLESATTHAGALSLVEGAARNYAGYLSAANAESEELCRALRIGEHAAAAIFTLATGKGSVKASLGEFELTLVATGPTDASHVGNWRIGWWLAHIVRDRVAIDSLAATPVEVLRRSTSRGDECQYLSVEALKSFEERSPDWSARLRVALDATDPEVNKISDEEFVLNIIVPELQMLFRLGVGEPAPFNEALDFALERHKKYWSKGKRKQDPDGYLALGPLAIASMAHDTGIPIEIESEYLPKPIYEGRCAV